MSDPGGRIRADTGAGSPVQLPTREPPVASTANLDRTAQPPNGQVATSKRRSPTPPSEFKAQKRGVDPKWYRFNNSKVTRTDEMVSFHLLLATLGRG